MSESWRPVLGYESLYEVAADGRVRSLDRTTQSGQKRRGKTLKPLFSGNGYYQVALALHGAVARRSVHRIVAEAFIGLAPSPAHQINHKNADKSDNRCANLEWVTAQSNTAHATRLGLRPFGIRHGNARLTDEEVREIRARYIKSGESQKRIAADYGISQVSVSCICRRKTWKHVKENEDG